MRRFISLCTLIGTLLLGCQTNSSDTDQAKPNNTTSFTEELDYDEEYHLHQKELEKKRLEPYKLPDPKIAYSDKKGFEDCLKHEIPDMCFFELDIQLNSRDEDALEQFCKEIGGYYSGFIISSTVPPTIYLFCSDEERISVSLEDYIDNLEHAQQYIDYFKTLETDYNLPEGTLLAIATFNSYGSPRNEKVSTFREIRIGFFQLSNDEAQNLGLNIDTEGGKIISDFSRRVEHPSLYFDNDDRFDVHLTAEVIAEQVSHHYKEIGDIDLALEYLFGPFAPGSRNINEAYMILHSGVCH